MTFSETKLYFSTSKKIKTCLRSIMGKRILNALMIFNIQNEIISNDVDLKKKSKRYFFFCWGEEENKTY